MGTNYKGFKDLKCWTKASQLRRRISELTKNFPITERFMLSKQIIAASRSVTSNIAEGYGRYTYSDTRHFFIQARGSLAEVIDHLEVALDEKYISEEVYRELEFVCDEVFRLINGYIQYIDKKKDELRSASIPNS